jgi:hypothetical protein
MTHMYHMGVGRLPTGWDDAVSRWLAPSSRG